MAAFLGFIGFCAGVFLGVAIAIYLLATLVKKSNDFGDSSGSLNDFSKYPVHIIEKQNNINYNKFLSNMNLRN